MKKLPIITLAVVTALILFQFVREVNATAYTNTSVVTVAVNESTVFAGPGAWSPSAAAPGSTYGPTNGGNLSWNTNADTYNLQVNKNADLTDDGTNTITLHTGTVAAPTAIGAGETWGFSLSNAASVNDTVPTVWNNGSNYAGPPTSAATVYSSTAAETSGNSWVVWWQAKTLASTESGTYTCTVTWTFTTTP